MNKQFESDRQCAEYMAALLEDERLLTIYERVPVYGSVALYMEAIRTYFFLNMGTRMNPDEIKISTVLYRSHDKMRVLVSDEDYCYVLPSEGKLRYGREKKYFERGKISGLKK